MPPPIAALDTTGPQPIIKLQMSGSILGVALGIILAIAAGVAAFSDKVGRAEAKAIVSEREQVIMQFMSQQNAQVLAAIEQLRYEIRNAPNRK
jgi:hypothetical protein